ncbi:HlyD family type I secretion periplasmic adaptor subunit [Roseococcus sp. SYP-B2431]|uniref:HlyD family type I secretion periplasmic adaptor subunit n=1 Tax=Roseococcus sp. SYP-B2431 TaxID=2496640 RepID=UPI00103B0BE8|nr:HlyD family type I secretion periplasmic adaptor subunit [Roseococcus sp. SYP-B2431]TCH96311.1 HlyD family type I secretion periplasmic adaptor subunit [Roseococcus sp. SYP-B2431]
MSARQEIMRRPIGLEFDPLAAERPRTGWLVGAGLFVTVGLFGGFMAWAMLAPLAEAAIAPGVIKVEGTRRTLSHLEGGIVREILVRDGSRVEAGAVVMRLDDVQSGATLEALRAQRFGLQAQAARLEAEAEGAPSIAFPADLLVSENLRAREAMAGQRALFEARTASLASQLMVLESRVAQQQAAISGAEGQIEATRRQLELMRQEETMRSGLVRQGLARVPELLALQRGLAALEGQQQDLSGQVRRAEGAIEEARGGIVQTRDQRRQEIGTEARDVAARLAETEERMRAAADVSARREIVAPEAGTIVNLRQFTTGAVLRAGDPAMDLVPAEDRLVAEVNVQPHDIDVVHVGLPAEMRLPAFRQRLIPVLHGHVTFVAADVTTDPQSRASYFRAQLRIDEQQLAALPGVTLVPGMPVEGHIQIGNRSFWRYLTQPIRDSLARAFHEQ